MIRVFRSWAPWLGCLLIGAGAVVGLRYYADKKNHEFAMYMLDYCGNSRVVSVGGCDWRGYCAVQLSNGKTNQQYMPAVGDICY